VAFTVDELRINDVTSVQRDARTAKLDRATPIADALAVEAIPSQLSWSIRIGYSSDTPSRVLCTGSVLDPSGQLIVTGWMSFAAETGPGWRELLLSPFNAQVPGLYTVRLVIEAPEPVTKELSVTVHRKTEHKSG
jgi:hypothetical protein